jgi:site-specific recombinase XerD
MIEHLGNIDAQDVTVHQLRAYVADLMDSDLSPFTVASRIRHAKRLWNFLEEEGLIEENPTDRIRTPHPKRKSPKGISKEDLRRLLENAQGDDFLDLRDRALILFLADTGARVGGVCGLCMEGLDLDAGLATVTEKGGNTRQVPFTRRTAVALRDWLKVAEIEDGPVFLGMGPRSEGALSPSGVHKMLSRRAKSAECKGPTNPHAFRHGFAREYLKNGGDLGTLADLLGHSTVMITKEYYAVFKMQELQKKHRQYSPVSRLYDEGGDGE